MNVQGGVPMADDMKDIIAKMYDEMQKGFQQVNSKMTEMDTEMQKGFQQVYSDMQKGFVQVYPDMQEGFDQVNSDMQEGFDQVNSDMRQGFCDVNNRIDNVENEVKDIKRTVLKIEHEHGEKLSALFDGYKQNSDKLDRIESEVSKHEEIILRRVR